MAEVVGKVLSITEDENGVTITARLAPGWTVELIEDKLRQFFWGEPDDFDFNEVVLPIYDAGPRTEVTILDGEGNDERTAPPPAGRG